MANPARTFAAIVFGLLLIAASPGNVPEPDGLWQGPMGGYTPNTVKGGSVLDTAALATVIAETNPVLLDVGPADRKPPSMSPLAVWLPAHRSIPGAVWMPGAGDGTSDPAFAAVFQSRIAELTGGDPGRPVVTFCHPDCWGSWNAAIRLVGLGYVHVYWYPDGLEGWQIDHELANVKADPGWAAASAPARTP
jgi:PQQ-dependent catabolism-associated CXXCW motif protein